MVELSRYSTVLLNTDVQDKRQNCQKLKKTGDAGLVIFIAGMPDIETDVELALSLKTQQEKALNQKQDKDKKNFVFFITKATCLIKHNLSQFYRIYLHNLTLKEAIT